MEKTIKYLENGEYHYATVKDVGDLAKLKTDSKDDLVTAINELFITGGEASKKPDGYDELVDNVADAIQKQQQMTDTITNMQQSAQLSDAEMQHMKQVQEEAHQDYIKALKEFNDAIAQANADALELDKKTDELKKNADDLNKKTNDLQDKLNETFTNVANEVSAVHKQLDTESAGLHKELNDTKTSLEATRKDLLNNTQEFGVVNSEVKELKDKMDRRIWSTDLDPVREQVNKNTTEVSQTKDELKNKADQSSLDLVTNSVENLSTQVKENADGLKVSVKKDELGGDVARLLNDKTNLLLGTRNFSGSNWLNKEYWHEEPGYWNGLKVYSSEQQYYGIQYQYYVKAGNTYTFSLWAKQDVENLQAAFYLLAENKEGIVDPLKQENVIIKTEWTRVHITFDALQDAFIYPRLEQTVVKNKLYVAGYKLELGKNATPWEPNEADIAENIEHTESQFNVYSDQIAGIVKKQEKMGDTERQLDTRITETAEGLKQTSKDLQDANGKITEFNGKLESTAHGLKTEYEKYTNDAIGQISDSSLNLIHNSAFSNQDDQFESWQNISAKATVREDSNNLHWVELTQSGQGTDNPIGVTSNYFIVKQGKVTVAVDVKLGDKANLDSQNILLLELYDENKKRVDFTDVSVSQLGLSMSVLNDHNVHRGLYRLGIDRKDVKYMTVKAILHRNGDLWLTNFSARLSSIDDGGYTPNPDDVNHQILKMNTKIEEDAKQIALKANSVDVTRDIKSAVQNSNGGGINLIKKSSFHNMTIDQVGNAWSIGQGVSINPKGGTGSAGSIIIDAQNIVDSNSYTEITQSIDVEPNTDYTFSLRLLWGKAASGKSFNAYTFMVEYTSDGGTTSPYQDNNRHIANSPSRSANTYTVHTSANTHSLLLYIRAMGGSYIELEEVKLERGPVATPWTPNSQDTSEEIKSAKEAAIQVASDQINLHVNELSTQFDDKLNKRVNEVKTASEKFTSDGIEQTVRKITDVKGQVDGVNDKVNNLKVGGRNLVRNTDTDIVIDDTGNTGTQGWHFATINLTQQPKVGDQITVSAEGTLSGKGNLGTYDVILYNSTTSNARSNSNRLSSGKRASATLQVNNLDGNGDTVLLIYAGNISDTEGKKNTVHHLKVEFGNVATDWTPAPEDVDSKFQYKEITGVIDFNDLKTQQKVFYKDTQARNSPVGGNYWYFLDVDVEPGSARIIQTATSDRNNITWKRTFADTWTAWQKQATQGDVDALRTETTASVKNLGDRVTTEVNSITSRVDNLKAGSQNLIADGDASAYGATPWENTTGRTHPYYYNSTKLMFVIDTSAKTELTSGCPNWFPVKAGQQYTLYFNGFMSTNVSSYDVWLLGKKADAQGSWADSYQIIGGERLDPGNNSIVTRTFTVPSSWNNYVAYVRFDNNGSTDGHSAVFFFNEVSVKEGNVNTGYSPAPENTVNEIKKLNTKWDVANGQIQGKVTATDVNNILNGKGYATQSWAQTMFTMKSDAITLQAVRANITDGIQNQVNSTNDRINDTNNRLNNLKVGGRNLLKGTSDCWRSLTGSGWLGFTTALDMYTSVADYHSGDQFTYSATITNPSTVPVRLVLYCYGANKQGKIKTVLGPSVGPGAGAMAVSVTITMDSQTWFLRSNIESLDGKSPQTTIQVKNEQLEVGNVRTSWTPNPNDGGSGVNLLRGTADFSWPDGIGENGTVNKSYEKFDDMTVALHISGNNSGIYTKWGRAFPDGQIQVGEQYTFSFDIKGTGTFSMVKNESESVNIASGIPVTSDYQRVKVTGTVKALDKAFVIYFQGAYDVYIKDVKIERGTIATPWTPHPFDEKNKGINLLKSTAYWNPSDWNHISDNVWYDDNWIDSKGHKAYGHHTAWQGLGQTVYVTPGVYTWSAQIYLNGLDSNDFVYPYMGDGQYNGTAQVQDIRKPMLGVNDQNRWIDYSTTFYVKNAGNLCVRPELNRDHGNIHVGSQKLEHGMVATPWSPSPYDFDPKNIVSAINITPDQIKIASNKIEIDGNTKIHGVLDVKQVTLQGKNGNIDLSGDSGIKIGNNVGATLDLNGNGVDIAYKNEFKMDINSSHLALLQRNAATDQKEPVTIGIFKGGYMKGDDTRAFLINYNPGSATDTQLHGADFMALGYTDPNNIGSSQSQIQLISRNFTSKKGVNYRKGIKFYDDITLQPYQKINIGDNDKEPDGKRTNDPLMIHRVNWKASSQTDRYQPTIRLGWNSNTLGTAGVTFLWDQLKPFGNRDISDLGDIWFNGMKFVFGYVHHNRMMGGADQPAFMRIDPGNGSIMSGIAFAPGSTWDLGSGAWNITGAMMNSRGA